VPLLDCGRLSELPLCLGGSVDALALVADPLPAPAVSRDFQTLGALGAVEADQVRGIRWLWSRGIAEDGAALSLSDSSSEARVVARPRASPGLPAFRREGARDRAA